MKIQGKRTENIEVEITQDELAYAIMQVVFEKLGSIVDDAGCDWFTRDDEVFIADKYWLVVRNIDVARLIDAMNILKYGHMLHVDFD
jgi:hypothetical protein